MLNVKIPKLRAGRACRKLFGVNGAARKMQKATPETKAMILNALAEKLKLRAKGDFKGRHFEAWLIIQAVSWYLRYPVNYRDLENLFAERGFDVDHATINRWCSAVRR